MNKELFYNIEYSKYISNFVSVYTGLVDTVHGGNTNMGQY